VKFQTFRAGDMYVEDSGEIEYLDDEQVDLFRFVRIQ
jgi:N-acetylneuraminate synthase